MTFIDNATRYLFIAGKGGVGKSTVVLMAIALHKAGYDVLILDTDESNPRLHRILGFDQRILPRSSGSRRIS